jgi:hypothetical protein
VQGYPSSDCSNFDRLQLCNHLTIYALTLITFVCHELPASAKSRQHTDLLMPCSRPSLVFPPSHPAIAKFRTRERHATISRLWGVVSAAYIKAGHIPNITESSWALSSVDFPLNPHCESELLRLRSPSFAQDANHSTAFTQRCWHSSP